MSTEAAGHGRLPELTGDARADRWREHRAAVRAELVEATLRAIEEYGPDLSIDDVVKTAGVTRPKLYRFFTHKDKLFSAVGERVQAMVLERVVPRFSLAGTALDMVRSAVAAYVDLVDERPNLFRFLVGAQFTERRSTEALLEGGRPLANATCDVVASVVRARGGNSENLQYVVDALLGAVALGVLRWLNEPKISKAALVEQLTTFVWGSLAATAAERGIAVHPDEQLSAQPQ
ncbi:TetR/AcrR family transcriptional regulator [Mycobacterium heckeshornense]|uniref:Putative transcriptional regulatory protein TetR n=1 Tax=Mycobacterium heckeshornense TaxID=110505 RepID=A0A2G8BJU4_9MYCO|nr:TetR/AcrR family transcriptional regulator [Mycobacterium heckeshornense]KMV24494.1 transcriptional regulator [Mycobacterium heckeshornense]MCV7035570.1 TetR/AcrR family transcriptional regulator [Mycobacterium heckeshornense]PIJ37876.1 TetR/AcrR family transcriptional regulator [Mycobacterium heckeshornense]BCO37832.1 putative transcriptional regulatory protein TetR [Mycobacterium heckeshornense]